MVKAVSHSQTMELRQLQILNQPYGMGLSEKVLKADDWAVLLTAFLATFTLAIVHQVSENPSKLGR